MMLWRLNAAAGYSSVGAFRRFAECRLCCFGKLLVVGLR